MWMPSLPSCVSETFSRSTPTSARQPLDRVTVVIPVWDEYAAFLPRAAESVLSEGPPSQVIAVDNASSTPLPSIDGVTLVRSADRLSAGAARNLGLERVQSPYVVFLDADDVLAPGTLHFLASQLDSHPEAAICVTSILEADTGKRHRTPRAFVAKLARHPRLLALAHSIWSLYPTQGCAMIRTRLAREAGGYGDASGGEDWVLGVSLAFRGRVLISERIGLYYHPREESLWRANRQARDLLRATALIRERLRRDPAIPGWARLVIPGIALLQLIAIYLLRPAYLAARSLRAPDSAPGAEPTREAGDEPEGTLHVREPQPERTSPRKGRGPS
jgi:glycosyltransferase involved in cell wall biosynthesis